MENINQVSESTLTEENMYFFEELQDFNSELLSASGSNVTETETDDGQMAYIFRMVRGHDRSIHMEYISTPNKEFIDHLNHSRFEELCQIVGPHEMLGVAWFVQNEWHSGFVEYDRDGIDVCSLTLKDMLPREVLSSAEALAIRASNRHLLELYYADLKKEVAELYRANDASGSKSVNIVFRCRSTTVLHHEYYSKVRADFVEGAAVWSDLTAVLDEIGDDQIFEGVDYRRYGFVMTELGRDPAREDLVSCLKT